MHTATPTHMQPCVLYGRQPFHVATSLTTCTARCWPTQQPALRSRSDACQAPGRPGAQLLVSRPDVPKPRPCWSRVWVGKMLFTSSASCSCLFRRATCVWAGRCPPAARLQIRALAWATRATRRPRAYGSGGNQSRVSRRMAPKPWYGSCTGPSMRRPLRVFLRACMCSQVLLRVRTRARAVKRLG